MVPILPVGKETDRVLLDSQRILTRSRALMKVSKALIDQTFRHLESFSTSLDADYYRPIGKLQEFSWLTTIAISFWLLAITCAKMAAQVRASQLIAKTRLD